MSSPDRPRESLPGQSPARTMPPPELFDRSVPASVGELLLDHPRLPTPVPRHKGPRAEEAHLRARILDARAIDDLAAERELSVALARLLAARGRDFGAATALAKRALQLGEDPALRVELAGWLAGLGETAAAAETLRDRVTHETQAEAARTTVKTAVLLARAGNAPAAAEALDEAASLDPSEAMAVELFGTLSAWAPETVTPEGAAAAYLEAARRRTAAGDADAAYEDKLRAFEIAPHDAAAADAVIDALSARRLAGAADEVLRLHAAASRAHESVPSSTEARPAASSSPMRSAHRRRMIAALKDRDAARAVGAMLDAELEGDLQGSDAAKVDEALSLAGLYELLAVRLEARAERQEGAARSESYQALARLSAGLLASHDRAIEAWIEALASDVTSDAARTALREHATSRRDPAPLAEALIRAGSAAASAARTAALRELAALATETMADAGLARWALDALVAEGSEADLVHAEQLDLAARVAQQDEELTLAKQALAAAPSTEGRAAALQRIVAVLAGRPHSVGEYMTALADLSRALPGERAAVVALERAAHRSGEYAALEDLLRSRTGASMPRVEVVRARLGLSAIARRRGDEARALEEVQPMLAETSAHRGAACVALLFATRAGRVTERADALVQIAGPAWPALRSVLLAVAAELYDTANAKDLARRTAERACEADSSSARAVAALSSITEGTLDRVAAGAVERAMTSVLPRGAWCERLAHAFDELGEPALAFAWTQRWLALHPGSIEAMTQLLHRAAATGDAARIGDALGWVLAQPRPLAEIADPIVDTVIALLDRDRPRARSLARRALDVIGPRVAVLRDRLLDLAERAADPGLAISVLERHLATGAIDASEGEVLLDLARRRTEAGDFDGAARELARATECEGDPEAVLDRVASLENAMREAGAWLGSDGLVALAEAKASALAARGREMQERVSIRAGAPDPLEAAAAAFRELGSLRWDLGEDPRGAEEAFFRACVLSFEVGPECYARDLSSFAGVHEALETLVARADAASEETSRGLRAGLLIEAAKLATENGMPDRGLTLAASAIEADPSRADAAAFVEKNAHVDGGIAMLDNCYTLLAGAALGCFGRRAAHQRAARQLERRGAIDLALRHAAACFEALPSEGTSFLMLTRLSERAGDAGEAVRALERVADAADATARPGWLKRAASLAGGGEEGARTRFDLLLRALIARPDPSTVDDVANAVREIGQADEMVRLRCERAVKASLRRLDGPDGARAAVSMARLAIDLGAHEVAFNALDRAMETDGDIDEFDGLTASVPALAVSREAAEKWILGVRATAEKPYSSTGKALLRLASRVAGALGDDAGRADLLVAATRRAVQADGHTNDDGLVEEATLAVAELGDPDLSAKLDAALPRVEVTLPSNEPPPPHDEAELDEPGEEHDVEARLRADLARERLAPADRTFAARQLARLLEQRGDPMAAFDVLAALAGEGGPPDADLLGELRGLARVTGDLARYGDVLAGAAKRAPTDDARLAILRELAPLHAEIGEGDLAAARYEEIARLDPSDTQALELLERAANERGDHEGLAALIAKRSALAPVGDAKRMLRLRRAAVLEQRLGQLDEAAAELEALLAESPDDVSALRFLSDVHERRGVPLAAAALLVRLRDLAPNSDEQAEYGLRAAAAYLAGGDIELASHTLDAIAPIAPWEQLVELRVEVSRATGDPRVLGDALEQLAAASAEPAERRAAFLLEAARTAASAGDDAAALDRARRALKLAPALPDAVLEARRLEYKSGGAGTPREALSAVEDLARIESRLEPSQIELHAFLLAEELDVIQGGGAGMRELSRRHAEVGPLPLIALGMAERMVRGKNFDAALPLFEHALSGDLRGLRSRGRVALAAAEAAASAQAFTRAAELLDVAASEPETQLFAQRKQLELAATIGDPGIARQALEELLRHATGLDRARVLLQLGRLLSSEDADAAARLFAEAAPLAGADRALPAQIAEAIASLGEPRAPDPEPSARSETEIAEPAITSAAEPSVEPTVALKETPSEALPGVPMPVLLEPSLELDPMPTSIPMASGRPLVVSIADPGPPPEPGARPRRAILSSLPPLTPRSSGRAAGASSPPPLPDPRARAAFRSDPPDHGGSRERRSGAPELPKPRTALGQLDEQQLLAELAKGSFEAGERLIAMYAARPGERAPDVLAVRRQQALLQLGDRGALQRLVEAAVLDGNGAYARAIEHVLHVWDDLAPPSGPPPLTVQRLAPDLVAALLFRSVADSAVHEALSLVLDTGLYRRDVGQYQLTGVARVQPTGGSVLGEVFGVVSRFLGLARTALFHQRGTTLSALSYKIALLSPPAIVMTGDVREETTELRYMLGAALAGAMPEHALVNALSEDALRTLIEALNAAFGPVAHLPRGNAAVARLGQNLWQLVPPRADRRLRELCSDLSAITYDAAVAGTRQAMRRAGLFASGSVACALEQIGAELALPIEAYQSDPNGLALACAAHPAIADLVRLSIRTELAEARWSPGSAQERRRADSGARLRWDVK